MAFDKRIRYTRFPNCYWATEQQQKLHFGFSLSNSRPLPRQSGSLSAFCIKSITAPTCVLSRGYGPGGFSPVTLHLHLRELSIRLAMLASSSEKQETNVSSGKLKSPCTRTSII